MIDISKLKDFAAKMLPTESILRGVLLLEDNEMRLQSFLERLPVYLRLARLEENWRKH